MLRVQYRHRHRHIHVLVLCSLFFYTLKIQWLLWSGISFWYTILYGAEWKRWTHDCFGDEDYDDETQSRRTSNDTLVVHRHIIKVCFFFFFSKYAALEFSFRKSQDWNVFVCFAKFYFDFSKDRNRCSMNQSAFTIRFWYEISVKRKAENSENLGTVWIPYIFGQ